GLDITTSFGDSLHGDAGDDRLEGLSGDDTLFGDADRDILIGGAGSDDLIGGSGDDTYDGGIGDDDMRDLQEGDNDSYLGFSSVSGADQIIDYGGLDHIEFSATANTRITDVTFSRLGSDLRVGLNVLNGIRIVDWYSYGYQG